MSSRRPRRTQPLEPWEELEAQMMEPVRKVDTTLIDQAPRDILELHACGTRFLHKLADALRYAPKPDGLMPQKEHSKAWSKRAQFLAKTDHEKARLLFDALRLFDLGRKTR